MTEKTPTELAWLKAYCKVCRRGLSDLPERELIVTTFNGNYGAAGAVITVNGSPPRAVMLVLSRDMVKHDGPNKERYATLDRVYILDSLLTSKLRDPHLYDQFTKSWRVKLWRATQDLLIERRVLHGEKAHTRLHPTLPDVGFASL